MSSDDPYVVDGVLVNKLGITSAAALSQAEADLSFAAILRLAVHPLPGSYDLGWRIAWHNLDAAENDSASAAALQGDIGPLVRMFEGIVRSL